MMMPGPGLSATGNLNLLQPGPGPGPRRGSDQSLCSLRGRGSKRGQIRPEAISVDSDGPARGGNFF
jgi:hypothetical protein